VSPMRVPSIQVAGSLSQGGRQQSVGRSMIQGQGIAGPSWSELLGRRPRDVAWSLIVRPTAAASNMERFPHMSQKQTRLLPWNSVYHALELLGAKRAREIGEFEPYALVTITGDGGNSTQEAVWADVKGSISETKEVEAKIAIASTQLTFVARSIVTKDSSPNEARFRVVQSDWESPKINLMHDVSKWEPGDKIVVASTDFDWRQAEVKTILPCLDCSPYQVKLE
ncbi:hypothetical protein RRG08_006571, partial [Elysia crispata]